MGKTAKMIVAEDLHSDDFTIVNNKVKTNRKFKNYVLTYAAGRDVIGTLVEAQYNDANRHRLQVLNGFGKIHLDFTPMKDISISNLFTLPADAPKNMALAEVQTFDGGRLWLDTGSRTVQGGSLKKGARYIVDIVSFFE